MFSLTEVVGDMCLYKLSLPSTDGQPPSDTCSSTASNQTGEASHADVMRKQQLLKIMYSLCCVCLFLCCALKSLEQSSVILVCIPSLGSMSLTRVASVILGCN